MNADEYAALRAELDAGFHDPNSTAVRGLLDALDEAERQRNALTLQLAAARGALNEYRDGYIGSDLAAGTLAGLDALRRPATLPPATDRSVSGDSA